MGIDQEDFTELMEECKEITKAGRQQELPEQYAQFFAERHVTFFIELQ